MVEVILFDARSSHAPLTAGHVQPPKPHFDPPHTLLTPSFYRERSTKLLQGPPQEPVKLFVSISLEPLWVCQSLWRHGRNQCVTF